MSYTTLYFGKSLEDVTYQDVEAFFVEAKEESDKIEFKSFFSHSEQKPSDKETGVIKSIAAMLNSEGGLIIWGAPIGQKIEGIKEKVFQGPLSPCEIDLGKDQFIGKVTDSVTPAPKGIRFRQLSKDQKHLYLIEVEKSMFSPHQFKSIYYMRLDGHSRPAPHHYVEALFRKVSFPRLEGQVIIVAYEKNGKNRLLYFILAIHNMSQLQNEHELYLRLKTSSGVLNESHAGNPMNNRRNYQKSANEIIMTEAKQTLYHKEPYTYQDVVIFSENDLDIANAEIVMSLYYGGKYSPLMRSVYRISLAEELLGSEDPLPFIISSDECQYAYQQEIEMIV